MLIKKRYSYIYAIYPLVLRAPKAVLIQGGFPLFLKDSKVKLVATVRFKKGHDPWYFIPIYKLESSGS